MIGMTVEMGLVWWESKTSRFGAVKVESLLERAVFAGHAAQEFRSEILGDTRVKSDLALL